MATSTVNYSASQSLACDLSSLASSSTFVAGRQSAQVDNTTDKYHDAIVFVDGINSHATTAPTVGQVIQVMAWGSEVSLATRPIDVLGTSDAAKTLGHLSVLQSLPSCGTAAVTVATANLKYWIHPFSIAQVLGLPVLPPFWGLFICHNHTGALAASQSGLVTWRGVKYDIA